MPISNRYNKIEACFPHVSGCGLKCLKHIVRAVVLYSSANGVGRYTSVESFSLLLVIEMLQGEDKYLGHQNFSRKYL
jgi:hypothetical protein